MMKLLLIAVGAPILLIIGYLLYRMRIGHVVAIHLYRFETMYVETFEETKSKELALKYSLDTFKECPILHRLSNLDYEQIVHILKESPSPEKIIKKIILDMDAKKSLLALKNAEFLTKMAAVRYDA